MDALVQTLDKLFVLVAEEEPDLGLERWGLG